MKTINRNQIKLDVFQAARERWVNNCRQLAKNWLKAGEPYVTIDDLTKVCPRPLEVHKNVAGTIFKTDDFEMCGWEKSIKPSSKGRWIMRWKLSNEQKRLDRKVERYEQKIMSYEEMR